MEEHLNRLSVIFEEYLKTNKYEDYKKSLSLETSLLNTVSDIQELIEKTMDKKYLGYEQENFKFQIPIFRQISNKYPELFTELKEIESIVNQYKENTFNFNMEVTKIKLDELNLSKQLKTVFIEWGMISNSITFKFPNISLPYFKYEDLVSYDEINESYSFGLEKWEKFKTEFKSSVLNDTKIKSDLKYNLPYFSFYEVNKTEEEYFKGLREQLLTFYDWNTFYLNGFDSIQYLNI